MLHRTILLSGALAVLAAAQMAPPPRPSPLRIRVGAVQSKAKILELAAGPHVVLSPSCQDSVCTVTVSASPQAAPNTVDYSGAAMTILARTGAALPGSCQTGEWFFLTSAVPGRNLHICIPANQWRTVGTEGTEVEWSDLAGDPAANPALAALLAAKADAAHVHSASQIVSGHFDPARLGAGAASAATFLRGDSTWSRVGWADLTGIPAVFPPAAHGHAPGDIAGLDAALAGKAPLAHQHDASDLATGRLDPSRLGAGTATAFSYLRGDGQWSAVSWQHLTDVPATFPPAFHGHAIADVTGLAALLAAKADAGHVHAASQITSGLLDPSRLGSGTASQSVFLRGDQNWSRIRWEDLDGVPATFPPQSHAHDTGDITGLQGLLNSRAPLLHTHDASDIISGTIRPEQLGTGTATPSAFLRGDGSWAQVRWEDLANRPDLSAQISPHTHPASDLQASGAQPGEVLKWTGTAWSPAPDVSGIPEPAVPPERQAGVLRYSRSSGWQVGDVSWSELAGVPAAFPPAPHSHGQEEVSGLGAALAGKAPLAHQHAAADIASGTLAPSRLGSGLPDADTVLHGDGVWRRLAWNHIDGRPESFPPAAHTHTIADIQMLQVALDSKAPLSHTHSAAQITSGLLDPARLGSGWSNNAALFLSADRTWRPVNWNQLAGVPSEFPPAAHQHLPADLLPGSASPGEVLAWNGTEWAPVYAGNLPGLVRAPEYPASGHAMMYDGTAWISRELQISDVIGLPAALDGKASYTHQHAAADITSGVISPARLGSGTASAAAFLRGDGVWAAVDWSQIAGRPDQFPPAAHTHSPAEISSGGAAPGQSLVWNGSQWTPAALQPAGDYLVRPASASAGQVLRYNAQGVWTAATLSMADISGLGAALAAKADAAHTHDAAAIVSGRIHPERLGEGWDSGQLLFLAADGVWRRPSWTELEDIPTYFPPAPHTHPVDDVSGLAAALSGKAPLGHQHTAADISSGILSPARLGSGTASATVFLRGDGSWAAVDWNLVANRPAQFPPTNHTHSGSDITSGSVSAQRLGTNWPGSDSGFFLSSDNVWRRVSYLDLKDVPNQFPPASHLHAPGDLTQDGAQTGQVLAWNGTRWAPATISGGGIPAPPSPQAGHYLRYNGSSWTGSFVSWTELTNVPSSFPPSTHTHPLSQIAQSGAQTGMVIRWNGTQWQAQSPPWIQPAAAVSGQYLKFDDNVGWITANVSFTELNDVPSQFPPTAHTHQPSDLLAGGAQAGQVLAWTGTAWAPSNSWRASGSSLYYTLGQVGIGTASPQSLLHLQSAGTSMETLARTTGSGTSSTVFFTGEVPDSSGPAGGVYFRGRNLWGTAGSPGWLAANTRISTFSAEAYTAPNLVREVGAAIFGSQEAWTSSSTPTMMQIVLVPRGSTNPTSLIRFEGDGAIVLSPGNTPANPAVSNEAKIYVRAGRLVIQYNDAGTIRYKSLQLSGTGTTWTHSTTAP